MAHGLGLYDPPRGFGAYSPEFLVSRHENFVVECGDGAVELRGGFESEGWYRVTIVGPGGEFVEGVCNFVELHDAGCDASGWPLAARLCGEDMMLIEVRGPVGRGKRERVMSL